MFGVEVLTEGACKDIEQLLGFARIQWKRMVYLELVQSWHGPEEEALRGTKHGGGL
jgi:hypothetical protein